VSAYIKVIIHIRSWVIIFLLFCFHSLDSRIFLYAASSISSSSSLGSDNSTLNIQPIIVKQHRSISYRGKKKRSGENFVGEKWKTFRKISLTNNFTRRSTDFKNVKNTKLEEWIVYPENSWKIAVVISDSDSE